MFHINVPLKGFTRCLLYMSWWIEILQYSLLMCVNGIEASEAAMSLSRLKTQLQMRIFIEGRSCYPPPRLLPPCTIDTLFFVCVCVWWEWICSCCGSICRCYYILVSVCCGYIACMCTVGLHLRECMCAFVLSRPPGDVPPGCHFISHLFHLLHSSFFIQRPNLLRCY